MAKVLEFKPLTSQGFKGIVYGESGVGKTSFAVSAALHDELKKVAVISIDRGLNTAVGVDSENIFFAEADTSDELLAVGKRLINQDTALNDYRTLVLDGVSQLIEKDLRRISDLEYARKPADRVVDVNQLQDWNTQNKIMSRAIDAIDAGKRVTIYTALVGIYDPTSQAPNRKRQRRPKMNDAAWETFVQRMDFVWHMYTMPDGSIHLQTQPSTRDGRQTYCKTRNVAFSNLLLERSIKENGKPSGVILIGHRTDQSVPQIKFDQFFNWYREATEGEAN